MKIIAQHRSVNPSNELLLCFDVSKNTLNLFSQYFSRAEWPHGTTGAAVPHGAVFSW